MQVFARVPSDPAWNSLAAGCLDASLSSISRVIAPAAFGVTSRSTYPRTTGAGIDRYVLAGGNDHHPGARLADRRLSHFLLTAVAISYFALLG